jgi:putative sigma-54 modulation protein
MNIIIKAHHVEITDALKEYASKKMEKLEHFFQHIQKITINLNVESSSREEDRQVASAIINSSGTIITGKESSESMYSSIDMLLDKLSIQLKKYKEKLKHHKGHMSSSTVLKSASEKTKPTKKRLDRYIPKPMGSEDAVQILQDEKLDFLVFRNLKERVCVIYQEEDGEFSVIET